MKYRKSTSDDCEKVYSLVCNLENKELPFDKFQKIYHDQVNNNNYYCLVAENNDEILAFLNLRFEEQLHHCERIAEIMEFLVNPAYRSQGIGKQMFQEAILIAKEHGCPQLELATNQLRTDAHRFYQREGMHNFHYKFSQRLTGESFSENAIGR
jgi:PhnO protein